MTEHNETTIVVEELVAGYGDRIVLDHVSFTVRRGEIFVILGGSGSGRRPFSGAL
jgi:phospholipid/cholesterol/gamma-HCH transport system ATP-binding protein